MAELMSDTSKEVSKAYEKKAVKFNPQRAFETAVKTQPNANYAVSLLLSREEAEPFLYLSHWVAGEKYYRVAARLNRGEQIEVQLVFVPNMPTNV